MRAYELEQLTLALENIEVYNILCDSVGLPPQANNGSLRLPLRPVALHNPGTVVEEPADPVSSYTLPVTTSTSRPTSTAATAKVGVDPVHKPTPTAPHPIQVHSAKPQPLPPPPPPTTGQPSDEGPDKAADGAKNAAHRVWNWFTDQVNKIWNKISGSKGKNSR